MSKSVSVSLTESELLTRSPLVQVSEGLTGIEKPLEPSTGLHVSLHSPIIPTCNELKSPALPQRVNCPTLDTLLDHDTPLLSPGALEPQINKTTLLDELQSLHRLQAPNETVVGDNKESQAPIETVVGNNKESQVPNENVGGNEESPASNVAVVGGNEESRSPVS